MLVLASNSPRRKQLLALGGWEFNITTPDIDETVLPGESPEHYVLRLAEQKAKAAAESLEGTASEEIIVLAADTAVILVNPTAEQPKGVNNSQLANSEILGKPADAAAAREMLCKLRNRVHQVYSGLAIYRLGDGKLYSEVVVTDVAMRNYSDEELNAYITSGDPLDKAGAYAIQHPVFQPVQNLQGCYANVMGLPVCHVESGLMQFGEFSKTRILEECGRVTGYPCAVFRQAAK
jgi:predicted house-cleaning NTP pyrophosphatase (Maf/HAM1 superfamily)